MEIDFYKDLRIGNILQDKQGRICKVEQLSTEMGQDRVEAIKGAVTTMPISPIPLTEEIVLRLGWELDMEFENNTSYFTHPEYYAINKSDKGYELMINHEYWITIKIDYVHELQNAIWALSSFKKELEVNL